MRMPKPESRRQNAADAQAHLPELLDAVRRTNERIVIEQDGAPVAALISADELVWLEFMIEKWEEGFEPLKATWEAFKDVPADELEREVARAVQEAREDLRRERLERQLT